MQPLRRPGRGVEQGALRGVGVEHAARSAQDQCRQPGLADQPLRGLPEAGESVVARHEVGEAEILRQIHVRQLAVDQFEVAGRSAPAGLSGRVESDRKKADQEHQKAGRGKGEQPQQEPMVGEVPPGGWCGLRDASHRGRIP